jgi:hypothetical protein
MITTLYQCLLSYTVNPNRKSLPSGELRHEKLDPNVAARTLAPGCPASTTAAMAISTYAVAGTTATQAHA